jgi:hypothetical protein
MANSTSRRSFLAALGAALSTAGGLTSRLFASPGSLAEADQFEALRDQPFSVSGDDSQQTLTLIAVRRQVLRAGDARPAQCRREPFSLLFRGRTGAHLVRGPHRLTHPMPGSIVTCLHPVGAEGTDYEVHFN